MLAEAGGVKKIIIVDLFTATDCAILVPIVVHGIRQRKIGLLLIKVEEYV